MPTEIKSVSPDRATYILGTLILVAAVANLNLSVANVALPDIGRAFDASQTQLNLIAIGYSLGLAGTVLYLGAVGDRYGRKMLLVTGMAMSIPASIVAGFAGNFEILFLSRVVGGISAGLAFPTTLAIITALWAGAARTKAIALWSAIGGAISALGPIVSGALLDQFDWGSVFLVTLPLALLALICAVFLVPAHVNETTEPVDHLGGVVSIVFIGALVLSINFAPVSGSGSLAMVLGVIALVAGAGFFWRERRASNPLFDLTVAARPTFWVAAVGGLVVFGSLMGAMFIGQQFLQNVLGYSTLAAGAAIIPAALAMIIVAPRSASMIEKRGARATLLSGYVFVVLGLLVALAMWNESTKYWQVALAYALVGIGVGLAGTPASRSLTGSVPVARAGMASGTSDLQRDLGGAIMQSILGAILTAGYAKSLSASIAASPQSGQVPPETQAALTKSFSSAEVLAQRYPQYGAEIMEAAKQAFLDGDTKAYIAAIIVVCAGAAVVTFCYPRMDRERELLAQYAAEPVAEKG